MPTETRTTQIRFVLEDPQSLTGSDQGEHTISAAIGQNLLDVALDHGIHIEHACGGVCACSTCHIHVMQGMNLLSEAQEEELDRVEQAPDLSINSRLACQATIKAAGTIVVKVPAWNRNAVKEKPHD